MTVVLSLKIPPLTDDVYLHYLVLIQVMGLSMAEVVSTGVSHMCDNSTVSVN